MRPTLVFFFGYLGLDGRTSENGFAIDIEVDDCAVHVQRTRGTVDLSMTVTAGHCAVASAVLEG